jgi:mRNA interferase RelE/StbE
MSYKIIWYKAALDNLKRLDKSVIKKVFEKVETYMAQDPIVLGKSLKQNLAGMFRYCYGDYHIIYVVNIPEKSMTILEVGYRKEIHNK